MGSGNSGALDRISSKALKGDFKGYVFSVNNTLKDLTYISDLLKDSKNGEQLSQIAKNFYSTLRKIKNKGYKSIAIENISNIGIGLTLNDRLRRASKKWLIQ